MVAVSLKKKTNERFLRPVSYQNVPAALLPAALQDDFFFQAEDGIRDYKVTGVQTCALPISDPAHEPSHPRHHLTLDLHENHLPEAASSDLEIGRASCRERV